MTVIPVAGNIVDVNYFQATGKTADGIFTFRIINILKMGNYVVKLDEVIPTILITSAGGTVKEDIESICKIAPFQYSAQSCIVTPLGYEAFILQKYCNFITDITCWSREDNIPPEYGTTFTSIVWKDNLSSTAISELQRSITVLTDELFVVYFAIKFFALSKHISRPSYFTHTIPCLVLIVSQWFMLLFKRLLANTLR